MRDQWQIVWGWEGKECIDVGCVERKVQMLSIIFFKGILLRKGKTTRVVLRNLRENMKTLVMVERRIEQMKWLVGIKKGCSNQLGEGVVSFPVIMQLAHDPAFEIFHIIRLPQSSQLLSNVSKQLMLPVMDRPGVRWLLSYTILCEKRAWDSKYQDK